MQKQIEKLLTSDMTGADEEQSRSKVRCYTLSYMTILSSGSDDALAR